MQQQKKQEVLVYSKFLRFSILSFLPGCDLYHKIALLDKETRQTLPKTGLFDQPIVITFRKLHDYSKVPISSLVYMVSLADFIQFQTNVDEIF